MRRYKIAITLLITVIMIAFTFFFEAESTLKLIVLIIGLSFIAYFWRGNNIYARATKIIAKRNPLELEKAMKMLEKALSLGISENNTVIASALLLQHGNIEIAKENLLLMEESSSKNIKYSAKASLSMYYYMKGDFEKAIKLAEEVKAVKHNNANLYANLCLYYLAVNDKKGYSRTLAEAFHYNATSIALIDIQATSFILQNEYQKAGVTIEKLFSQIEFPSYPDPYIHYAMIYLHYGYVREAINKLKDAKLTYFSNTSLLTLEEVEEMIEGLEKPETRLKWVDAINQDRSLAIKRHLPRIRKIEVERCDDDILSGYDNLPNFSDDRIMQDAKKEAKDNGIMDTSLNDDDEKWLLDHPET